MGQPSAAASNAIIYVTYALFLYEPARLQFRGFGYLLAPRPLLMTLLMLTFGIVAVSLELPLRGSSAISPKESSSLETGLKRVRNPLMWRESDGWSVARDCYRCHRPSIIREDKPSRSRRQLTLALQPSPWP